MNDSNEKLDEKVIEQLKKKILVLESQSLYRKDLTDSKIKDRIRKMIEEEVNVNRFN